VEAAVGTVPEGFEPVLGAEIVPQRNPLGIQSVEFRYTPGAPTGTLVVRSTYGLINHWVIRVTCQGDDVVYDIRDLAGNPPLVGTARYCAEQRRGGCSCSG
jgi:hypothetical protein